MFRSTLRLAIILTAGLSAMLLPSTTQAAMWACDFSGNLYGVDASTAALSFIGNTGIDNPGALEFGPDGKLYALHQTVLSDGALYSIDPTTAAATYLGTLGLSSLYEGGLAFSNSGTAYGVESFDGFSSYLFSVNLSNATATNIGPLDPYIDINGLTWRNDGMLVGLADDYSGAALVSIDPNTGATTLISNLGFSGSDVGGMATDLVTGTHYLATGNSYGNDYNLGTNSLYTFDAFTGATSLVGTFSGTQSDSHGISGLASDGVPSTVPEPGTLGLLGLGLISLGIVLRRRA